MPEFSCSCGYQATSDDDLTDHLSHALIPADDRAGDGQLHAEAAHLPGQTCLCGYAADAVDVLDAHLLAAFAVGAEHAPGGVGYPP